jgi:hypothetical protein
MTDTKPEEKTNLETLSSSKDGNFELLNVKFFLGDSRNISQDDLLKEAAKGVHMVKSGASQKVEHLDNHLAKTPLSGLLA